MAAAPPVPSKNATTAKELRDLMYKHYCIGKGKLKNLHNYLAVVAFFEGTGGAVATAA